MPTVEIDEDTDRYLSFAARVAQISKGAVVARLVAGDRPQAPSVEPGDSRVAVHADYAGYRTAAMFVPGPARVEIVDGPLAGQVFRSPSEAARAVVSHYRPTVSAHRNGWSFWIVTATGLPLQAIRRQGR
jgi:hypothetical protein